MTREIYIQLYCGNDDHSEKAEVVQTHAYESEWMADARFAWTELLSLEPQISRLNTLRCFVPIVSRFLTMTSV